MVEGLLPVEEGRDANLKTKSRADGLHFSSTLNKSLTLLMKCHAMPSLPILQKACRAHSGESLGVEDASSELRSTVMAISSVLQIAVPSDAGRDMGGLQEVMKHDEL